MHQLHNSTCRGFATHPWAPNTHHSRSCAHNCNNHRQGRRSKPRVRAVPEDDSAAEPQLFGDWREFRAKLILGEQHWHMSRKASVQYCAVVQLQCDQGFCCCHMAGASMNMFPAQWLQPHLTAIPASLSVHRSSPPHPKPLPCTAFHPVQLSHQTRFQPLHFSQSDKLDPANGVVH